jgi:hypothetical protein
MNCLSLCVSFQGLIKMKQTITFSRFCDAFKNMGRNDQFSHDAKKALFDYLEENNPDYDLDVIELCCWYVEYDEDEEFDSDSIICELKHGGALCHA